MMSLNKKHVLLIDNFDSFTYNLVHLFKQLGAEVSVVRNNLPLAAYPEEFDKIVLSPGPGIPSEAGNLLEAIRIFTGKKPVLGVCLGHQAIAEVFGGKICLLPHVYHGVATEGMITCNDYLFHNLPPHIPMGRYHSWVVDSDCLPDCLEVTAQSSEGHIMALRHREHDIRGIQFHPESILTPDGQTMMANWLSAE
ncbi:MAG: aminodeoxychorismate/anthranilate synthase component II [Prevotella sp.]|nr:aminodeoxychorismate/anthranilate synthase component II [Prevotella sp.]